MLFSSSISSRTTQIPDIIQPGRLLITHSEAAYFFLIQSTVLRSPPNLPTSRTRSVPQLLPITHWHLPLCPKTTRRSQSLHALIIVAPSGMASLVTVDSSMTRSTTARHTWSLACFTPVPIGTEKDGAAKAVKRVMSWRPKPSPKGCWRAGKRATTAAGDRQAKQHYEWEA